MRPRRLLAVSSWPGGVSSMRYQLLPSRAVVKGLAFDRPTARARGEPAVMDTTTDRMPSSAPRTTDVRVPNTLDDLLESEFGRLQQATGGFHAEALRVVAGRHAQRSRLGVRIARMMASGPMLRTKGPGSGKQHDVPPRGTSTRVSPFGAPEPRSWHLLGKGDGEFVVPRLELLEEAGVVVLEIGVGPGIACRCAGRSPALQ